MNGTGQRFQPSFPRMTRGIRNLMIGLVVTQIVFLLIVHAHIFGEGAAKLAFGNLPLHTPDGIVALKVWQVLTYMWIHDPTDIWHLIFNLVVLYFFGPLFERSWGMRDFMRFFVLCGIGGGVLNALLGVVAPAAFGGVVVGASAGMLGLIVAFGLRFPTQTILLFFIIPVQGRHIILITVLGDLLIRLSGSPIAIAAHWGGMITAYLLITGNWRSSRWRSLLARGGRKKKSHQFEILDGGKEERWPN